ncbi:MAG: undecaprenyldiphospho-muramoylpentapeptide beta-N-acetylglucosaminyltransferase [Mycobacteriales bacterium]
MSDVHVVLAGGGSAGHVEPMMNTADALRRLRPDVGITALGTAEGLEQRLVPQRGYELAIVPKVPLPRGPSADLLRVPGRLLIAVRAARAHLDAVDATVVVGFGGYVAAPAYLAARRRGTAIVIHEQNARAGVANRLGARWAKTVAAAVGGSGLKNAHVIGIPLRTSITGLDRAAAGPAARAAFGLTDGPVLLVFGGSLGARSVNTVVVEVAPELAAAGVQVLHVTGAARAQEVRDAFAGSVPSTHHLVDYVDDMAVAYAAADLALCRAGANTCAELAAVGLPAVYVPLPIGNGEQALNARPIVDAGGGLLVSDAALDANWIRRSVLPLLQDPAGLAQMAARARTLGHRDADVALARLVLEATAP